MDKDSAAFSIPARDFGISDFIFMSWELLIVSRPTLNEYKPLITSLVKSHLSTSLDNID
jgi:hypothetical protein